MDRQFEELITKEILDTPGLAEMMLDAEEEREAKNQMVRINSPTAIAGIRQI